MRVILILLMFFCSGSFAAEQFTTRDMVELLDEAKRLTAYHKPIPLPKIVFLSTSDIQREYCKGSQCEVSAFHRAGVVYLDTKISRDNVLDRSIVVHEFIHYIQKLKVGDTYTCKMWYQKELEAYKLQAQYLYNNNTSDAPIRNVVSKLKCTE
jgi:hypothetical protein